MKICVVGLGLIGGSIAKSLKRANFAVDGLNRSPAPIEYALKNNVIDNVATDLASYDVVFVALPVEATVAFIDKSTFKDGAIVSDICGVKGYIAENIEKKARNFRYVGLHPMAGKEVASIHNASETLFDNANMVIAVDEKTDLAALELIKELTKAMGFKTIVECSAKTHDEKISYTSQLAHIVSNAYVKDEQLLGCISFTGGSFQDMTRIAPVDEKVWSELYLKNADNLIERIEMLEHSLDEIKKSIASGDKSHLEEILRCGKELYLSDNKQITTDDIKVTLLK